MPPKRYIGIKELAEYIDVKVNTLYSWVNMKQIPYYKVGRLVKFDKDEIDKWMEKKRVEVYKMKPLEW
jgi:excisionase family DNA binding protein